MCTIDIVFYLCILYRPLSTNLLPIHNAAWAQKEVRIRPISGSSWLWDWVRIEEYAVSGVSGQRHQLAASVSACLCLLTLIAECAALHLASQVATIGWICNSPPLLHLLRCLDAWKLGKSAGHLQRSHCQKDLLKYLLNASICHGNGNCISVAIEIFQLTRLIKVYGLNYARVLFALNYWPALT